MVRVVPIVRAIALPARVATLTATAARVAAASPLLRSCFVDGQASTFELSLVEGIARLTALIGVRHFDEAEPHWHASSRDLAVAREAAEVITHFCWSPWARSSTLVKGVGLWDSAR